MRLNTMPPVKTAWRWRQGRRAQGAPRGPHTPARAHSRPRTHAHTHAHTRPSARPRTLTPTHARPHVHMHARARLLAPPRTLTPVHACTQARAHAHAHARGRPTRRRGLGGEGRLSQPVRREQLDTHILKKERRRLHAIPSTVYKKYLKIDCTPNCKT